MQVIRGRLTNATGGFAAVMCRFLTIQDILFCIFLLQREPQQYGRHYRHAVQEAAGSTAAGADRREAHERCRRQRESAVRTEAFETFPLVVTNGGFRNIPTG